MSPSPKWQVMFASAFSSIGDYFRIFGIHTFYATATFVEYINMHAMNMWLTGAATVVVGADWTLHPWRHNNVGGVTAGQARHISSNVGGVTVGQAGHNSS